MTDTDNDTPVEIQRRRLRFRSWHRGTRESDLLLGGFADQHLGSFDQAALDLYAALLEENDPDLWDWIVRGLPMPAAHDNAVVALLRQHVDSKAAAAASAAGDAS